MAETHKFNRELGKAVNQAIKKWRNRFGLPSWPVFAIQEDGPLKSGNLRHPRAIARVDVAEAALEVYVWYMANLRLEVVDRVICHEMGHWIVADLWEFLHNTLNKRDYAEARRLIEHIVETYTIALIQPNRRYPFDPEVGEEDGR